MTDNEIIKALKATASWVCDECKFHGEMCDGDKCEKVIAENALDLINRQKAEIERLEKEVEDKEKAYNDEFCLRKEWQSKCRELLEEKEIIKPEAIKEFADRLCDGRVSNDPVVIAVKVELEMMEAEK